MVGRIYVQSLAGIQVLPHPSLPATLADLKAGAQGRLVPRGDWVEKLCERKHWTQMTL